MSTRLLAMLALGLSAAATPVHSQDGPRLDLRASFEPATARPGETVTLRLELDIAEGFHVYGARESLSEPTSIVYSDLAGLIAQGEPVIPPGDEHEPFEGMKSYWIAGNAVLKHDFRVPAGAAGELVVAGHVAYMACTETFCDPPAEAAFTARLEVAAAAAPVPPAPVRDEQKLTTRARFDPPRAKAGQEVDLVVEVTVAEGWHVYGSGGDDPPVTFVAGETMGIAPAGAVRTPEGAPHELFGLVQYWLDGTFELRQRLRVAEDEAEGELLVDGEVRYMVCDDKQCLPEDAVPFDASLEIVGGDVEVVAPPPVEPTPAGAASSPQRDPFGTWGGLILLAFLGGLLALAMPCTYPMIPITFSFFTKQADARGGNVLPLALTYGAGIVTIFILIGLLVGEPIQHFAQHWLTNAIIGAVFVVFALSLFGLITLEPPRALQELAGKASTKGGYLGVFLMGLCLVITSFTCTMPVVGALLVVGPGGLTKVTVGMGVFGLTMALPFVALAMLPGRVRAMPRAGEWMNTLKVTLGFVELAAALKFVSNFDVGLNESDFFITRQIFGWSWFAIFVVTALYLLGAFGKGVRVTGARVAWAVLMLLIAAYSVWGAYAERLDPVGSALFPPSKSHTHEVVVDDHARAVASALAQDKLLLMNFTGFT